VGPYLVRGTLFPTCLPLEGIGSYPDLGCNQWPAVSGVQDPDIIVCSSELGTERLIKQFISEFAVRDHGELKYFLEIEVNNIKTGIQLSHKRYDLDLLKSAGMERCKHERTTLNENEQFKFRSIIDGL
jgi:hypothetical protein